ncbi:SPL3 [Scenedesmus sp. PABB004]|nr:SPL3 [Scenedesmus sp. PABB004]
MEGGDTGPEAAVGASGSPAGAVAPAGGGGPSAAAAAGEQWCADDFTWDAFTMIAAPAAPEPEPEPDGARRRPARAAAGAALRDLLGSRTARARRGAELVCQVPGCTADLAACKGYHQRYRICEDHAKMEVVQDLPGGAQRFCQQCARFHALAAFDGAKRSCRQQLQRHNALRRKGPAAPAGGATSVTASAAATVVAPRGGKRGASGGKPAPAPAKRSKAPASLRRASPPKTSSIESNTQLSHDLASEGGERPAAQGRTAPTTAAGAAAGGGTPRAPTASLHQSPQRSSAAAGAPPPPREGDAELLWDLVGQLLDAPAPESAAPAPAPAPAGDDEAAAARALESILGQLAAPAGQQQGATSAPARLQDGGWQGSHSSSVSAASGSDLGGAGGAACFSSAPGCGGGGALPVPGDLLGDVLSALAAFEPQQQPQLAPAGLAPLGGLLAPQAAPRGSPEIISAAPAWPAGGAALMEACGDWVPHTALLQLHTVSLKLHGVTPASLAPDLRDQLVSAVLRASLHEAFLRPGCTLVTLDAWARHAPCPGGAGAAAEAAETARRLCGGAGGAGGGGAARGAARARVQAGRGLAEWAPGRGVAELRAEPPAVTLVSRPALLSGADGDDDGGPWLAVAVDGLARGEALAVSVRCGGAYQAIAPGSVTVEPCALAGARRAGEAVLVWLQLARAPPRPGPLRLEVTAASSGASGSALALACDDAALVAELNAAAERGTTGDVASEQALLGELGLALEVGAALADDAPRGVGAAGRRLAHYSGADVALLVRSARRLVAAAVRAGCPATAAALLPLAGVGLGSADALLDAVAAAGTDALPRDWAGAGLLHLAVASQSAPTLAWLLAWGAAAGATWLPRVTAAAAPGGLSPLHLAALADCWHMAELLTDVAPAAAAAWFGRAAAGGDDGASASGAAPGPAAAALLASTALLAEGATPAALAALAGRVAVNAAVARKLPGDCAAALLAEAAADAAAMAAGRPTAAAAAAAAAEQGGKPKPGGAAAEQLCPDCALPLASFGGARWHQHGAHAPGAEPGGKRGALGVAAPRAGGLDAEALARHARGEPGLLTLRVLLVLLAAAALLAAAGCAAFQMAEARWGA